MKMNSRLHQYSENLAHIKSKEERLEIQKPNYIMN